MTMMILLLYYKSSSAIVSGSPLAVGHKLKR